MAGICLGLNVLTDASIKKKILLYLYLFRWH